MPGLRVAAAVLGLLLGEPVVLAQHHHDHASGDSAMGMPARPTVRVHGGFQLETGTVDAFGGDRAYQGLAVMIGAQRDRISLMVHLPFYRIELGAGSESGLGDLHVAARYVAIRRWRAAFGATAGVMAPTGDDSTGIGMGHWMIMAGCFARRSFAGFATELTVGYGGATTASGHAEHGVDVWPPVAPMNAQELRATASVNHPLWRRLAAGISAEAAIPLGDGAAIAQLSGEFTFELPHVSLVAGVRHGLGGHTLHNAFVAGATGWF